MEIRIRETGQLVTEQEFRAMHANVSFASLDEATLDAFGADVVFEGPQASGGDRYQFSMRQGVEQLDGKWYTKHVLGPVFIDMVIDGETITAAQQEADYKARKDAEQAAYQRAERTRRLAETDWRFRSDMNPSQEWKDYCQALRDITSQPGFPWDIQWPSQPA
jgi:hypothetical protein